MFVCTRADFLPRRGRPYRLMSRVRHGSLRFHRHEFVEIGFVHEGEVRHHVNGEGETLTAGGAFLIPVGSSHSLQVAGEVCLSNVLLAPELVTKWQRQFGGLDAFARPAVVHFRVAEMTEVQTHLERLAAAQETTDPSGQLAAHGQLLQFVGAVLRAAESQGACRAQAVAALSPALNVITAFDEEPITVARLASAAGVSERSLTRLFRQATGHAPLDYVLRRRLSRAAERLQHEDTPITEIALACGFGDSNYFSRQFRRVHGCTPTEFRAHPGDGPRARGT